MSGERLRFSETDGHEVCLSGQTAVFRRREGEVRISLHYRGAYGLGEKFDAINQKGKVVRNRVIEKFCNQGAETYCSVPFFFTDSGLGIFADTKRETIFAFEENDIRLTLPPGTDLVIFTGGAEEIVRDFLTLLGNAAMPPRFAFGPWVSANHWDSRSEVERVAAELREYRFPATVLVLEAWSDEATFYIFNGAEFEPKPDGEPFLYEDFTFPEEGPWPDPRGMIRALRDEGIHTVLWQIPAYRRLENSPAENGTETAMRRDTAHNCAETATQHRTAAQNASRRQNELDASDALRRGLCVMRRDGTPYRIPAGNWFEGALIPDFTNPLAARTWLDRRRYLLDIGVDGFKTDGGEFIYEADLVFHGGDSGREQKNAYCQNYIAAYHEMIGGERVLFSRAGYTGAQRTPILWAGDHQSTFAELRAAYVAAISAACSGILYWGFDIGGFAGPLPSAELYWRSTQLACFCPVMQWHSEPDGGQFRELLPGGEGNNERSPWNIARAAGVPALTEELRYWHRLRMLLLPYICSEAAKSARDGIPMMRPLFFGDTSREAFRHEDEYYFGESLLVAPILEEGRETRDVYLPAGEWYGFFTGRRYAGGAMVTSKERYPVFLKGGAAVVMRAPAGALEDPDFAVDNQVDGLTDLVFVTAGERAEYEFIDERGAERLRWSRERGLEAETDSRVSRAAPPGT